MKKIFTQVKMGFLGALALAALSPACFAKVADYCTPVAKLTGRLSSCSDNEILFSDAAVACLNKFKTDADVQTNDLQNMMLVAGNAALKGQSQQEYLGASEQNYLATEAKLSLLLLSGQRALQQIAEYRANLAMPEDFESAESMGFTTENFLKGIPCFEENRKLLLSVVQDLMQETKELKTVRDMALAQAKAATAAKNKISAGSVSGNAAVTGGQHASGEGAVRGKPQTSGTSDITGTDRKPTKIDP
jgi:hypothetical protein